MADLNADVECKTSFKIDYNVRKRLYAETAQSSEEFYGILIGDNTDGSCDIVGCIRCTYDKNTEKSFSNRLPHWIHEVAEICTLIPTGLKICGVCFVSQSKPILDSSSISEIFSGADMKSDLIDNTQILWVLDPVSKEEEDDSVFVYNLLSKSVEESKVYFNNINDEFISKHMTLRLHHKFDILVEKSSDVDISSGLCKKITQFCNKLHDAIFYLPECRLLIGGEMTQSSGKKCQDILDDIIMNEEASKAKYNQRLKTQLKDVLNVRLVKSLSKDDTLKCHNHAPVMLYQKL
ncbi:uncharacterized protein LOC114521290 [Dendronephthya gigantea]|uniref:uncharacterized protein LOC114521283 n=1 Tax=Dendronephthya gigantea TaxID=151771 RepID=UPI00106CBD73|nr:uncharacterized protein LOC114521282 isoform X2 [Dendronephthya gigantea]XP_028397459.1 uncharacterized protein LOC114521283 [Dendronephthya gigantea]XP_028397468.1 uncharacterized protein LOC114521290 [Dendronephthya gigantea]